MDPQQRILLELTWEALEDADIVPARLAGSDTGVFIGVSSTDYGALQRRATEGMTDPYAASGSAAGNVPNRISYFFDFHGPSLAIDTACSSGWSLSTRHARACGAAKSAAASPAASTSC